MTLNLVQRDEVGTSFESTALDELLADLLVVDDHESEDGIGRWSSRWNNQIHYKGRLIGNYYMG